MKKPFLLLLLFVFLGTKGSWAAKIDQETARKIAVNVYKGKALIFNHTLKTEPAIKTDYTVSNGTLDVYYIFNMTTDGWVVISSDDRVNPVLAFSLKGSADPEKGSPEFKWWMDGYAQQIKYISENNIAATEEIAHQWLQLSGGVPEAKGPKSLVPLLSSPWDQGQYYNLLCPEDPNGPGGHVWSGCVATCMAQVMYYYRYPLQGTGSHGYNSNYGYLSADFGTTTYQWDAMEDNISNCFNVPMAELQYHLGIAIEMDYSPYGSGAYMWNAAQALIDNFGYSPSLTLEQKDDYTDAQWTSMLKAELDAKHPVCYAGYGSDGGHAFVCDGYEGSNHFHFNWGWSGSNDGYFFTSALNPGYDFTNGQQAIFGMYPDAGYPYGCSGTKTLTASRGTFDDGSGPVVNYSANGDCLWLIDPEVTSDHITLSFNRFETENSNDVVTIYDGATTADPVLGTFSGSSLPAQVQSSGGKMLVRFVTNGSVNAPGWFASYRAHSLVYCSNLTELTAPSGSFSDGSGANPYNNATSCHWRIAPPGATGITINFVNYDLEANDFIQIYDNVSNTIVGTYYGNTLPPSVFVFSSKVLVLFKSDNFITAGGFDATYTSSNSGIEGTSPLKGLCVYPNPAKNFIHLTSGIAGQEAVQLRLYTPTGQQIIQQNITPSGSRLDETLDVSGLAKGLYFMVLETSSSRQTIPVTKE
jgi:hypothetical protein